MIQLLKLLWGFFFVFFLEFLPVFVELASDIELPVIQ